MLTDYLNDRNKKKETNLVQSEVVEYDPDEDHDSDWHVKDEEGLEDDQLKDGKPIDLSQDLSKSLTRDLAKANDVSVQNADNWDNDEFNGYIGGSTLEDISSDYNVPLQYIVDCCMNFGAESPVQPTDLLGHLINGEDIFSLLEVLNSYDNTIIDDIYSTFTVVTLAERLNVEVEEVFAILFAEGGGTGLGVRSQLKHSEVEAITSTLGKDVDVIRGTG